MTPIEASTFKSLKHDKKKFKIEDVGYETEEITYKIESVYVPDFVVTFADGRKMYIECKGWLRPEDKKKMKLVKQQNPELDIRFVFQRNNRFPRSKVHYGDWADRLGFPWCVGVIPAEWMTQ